MGPAKTESSTAPGNISAGKVSPLLSGVSLRIVVFALFFVSGGCGLIYEVLWCRQLGLIFGNTVQSLSAVLTAFMAGLALGSYVAGRIAHRIKRPLLAYGFLELLIGTYCAALPWLFSDHGPVVPLYRALYGEAGSASLSIARFAICLGLLLIPTTLMGATLPVLSQYLTGVKSSLGRTAGALYAVNTFGAVFGAAVTGFYFLPAFGKLDTNWIAVTCNIALGLMAMNIGLRETPAGVDAQGSATPPPNPQFDSAHRNRPVDGEGEPSAGVVRLAVAAFAITGFAGMATQIAWTRAISLGTGSSTYAFSLIVSVFILGLSLGGAWAARVAPKLTDPAAMLGKVLVLTGLIGLAITVILGYGPLLFFILIAWTSQSSWTVLLMAQAFGIALIILVPTFLMGATLPLTMQTAARYRDSAGRTVGTLYSVNTVGAILGSFLGGLLLLPLLTIQYTLIVSALMYAVPGLLLLRGSSASGKLTARSGVVIAIVLVGTIAVSLHRWDGKLMSSGIYLLRDPHAAAAVREGRISQGLPNFKKRHLTYYREGAAATVAVTEIDDYISLSIGGKPDASCRKSLTGSGDMSTQIGLTLVPEVLHPTGAEDVLVIGLGSGVSAGAALAPNTVKRVDVIEMSPEVVEASEKFKQFNELEYQTAPVWLHTPKIEVLVNDGRNHLLLSSRKYDVIASEPSNPWMAGVGNLFTEEAFALARAKLKPGGIMSQWVHGYQLEYRDFCSIIRTFNDVFPFTQFWAVGDGDFLLIGSDTDLIQPLPRLRERLAQPEINRWFAKVHYDTPADFLAGYLAGRPILEGMGSRKPLHTDDNMLLEFSAPRALYTPHDRLKASEILAAPEEILDLHDLPVAERDKFLEELDLATAARHHEHMGTESEGPPEQHAQVALQLWPHQRWATENSGRPASPPPPAQMLTEMRTEAQALIKAVQHVDDAMLILRNVTKAVLILSQRSAFIPADTQLKKDLASAVLATSRVTPAEGQLHLERVARWLGREIEKLGGGRETLDESIKEIEHRP